MQTSHGEWDVRRSIILREEGGEGSVRYGEVAPTPGFVGGEFQALIEEAQGWVRGQGTNPSPLFASALSCLSCGIWAMQKSESISPSPVFSARLQFPGGQVPVSKGTVKRKIGMGLVRQEIEETLSWLSSLPSSVKVRLDANESLDVDSLGAWIKALDGEERLEMIEQPLPRDQLDVMVAMAEESTVSLAVDESVFFFGGGDEVRQKGWTGLCVIKPALMPNWVEMMNFIKSEPQKCVVSTVFESPFGFEAVCRCALLADTVAGLDRGPLEGREGEFPEHHQFPLYPLSVGVDRLEELWETL